MLNAILFSSLIADVMSLMEHLVGWGGVGCRQGEMKAFW